MACKCTVHYLDVIDSGPWQDIRHDESHWNGLVVLDGGYKLVVLSLGARKVPSHLGMA